MTRQGGAWDQQAHTHEPTARRPDCAPHGWRSSHPGAAGNDIAAEPARTGCLCGAPALTRQIEKPM